MKKVKRVEWKFTQEDSDRLHDLEETFGESPQDVMRSGLKILEYLSKQHGEGYRLFRERFGIYEHVPLFKEPKPGS